ncbi:hypothetical protein JCM16163A_05780 [Paenibacillus sp. YK5]
MIGEEKGIVFFSKYHSLIKVRSKQRTDFAAEPVPDIYVLNSWRTESWFAEKHTMVSIKKY